MLPQSTNALVGVLLLVSVVMGARVINTTVAPRAHPPAVLWQVDGLHSSYSGGITFSLPLRTVFAVTNRGGAFAVAMDSGKVRWSIPSPEHNPDNVSLTVSPKNYQKPAIWNDDSHDPKSPPTVAFLLGSQPNMVAFDATTGKLLWNSTLVHLKYATACASEVVTLADNFYAHCSARTIKVDPINGTVLEVAIDYNDRNMVVQGITVDESTQTLLQSSDGTGFNTIRAGVQARCKNLTVLWSSPMGYTPSANPTASHGYFMVPTASSSETSFSNPFFVFNSTTGNLLWSHTPMSLGPSSGTYSADAIYYGDNSGFLWARNASYGTGLWFSGVGSSNMGGSVHTPPVVVESTATLFVGGWANENPAIFAFDLDFGALYYNFTIASWSNAASGMHWHENILYFIDHATSMYALDVTEKYETSIIYKTCESNKTNEHGYSYCSNCSQLHVSTHSTCLQLRHANGTLNGQSVRRRCFHATTGTSDFIGMRFFTDSIECGDDVMRSLKGDHMAIGKYRRSATRLFLSSRTCYKQLQGFFDAFPVDGKAPYFSFDYCA